ncbi:unnamed protein product, partial [Medioppia subpectinata]
LQDKLRENVVLDLPQIVVIGGQSSGKSSVLESIVGRDFLPRGSGIVTRRPLVLQLISDKNNTKPFGEFLHSPGKRFYNFHEIRDEITAETKREVKESTGVSSKPINLKIYSPDVLDLTLVDLPGMTRVAVGDQPNDIEKLIENMILNYIKKDNCLILAVTAANQDLATSDALKLAKRVDPKGDRTIAVLTQLDIMNPGTNARDILNGKHKLQFKRDFIGVVNRSQKDIDEKKDIKKANGHRDFIGVVNRSQKDIDEKKDIKKALADESKFFAEHPAYGPEMAKRLGIKYLQEYLQQELSNHISRKLPPLKSKLQLKLRETNDRLEKIEFPLKDDDKEGLLSDKSSHFLELFKSSMGGKVWEVNVKQLSGGSKINLLMNDTFATEVDQMFCDESRLNGEIVTAIQNAFGTRLGVFVPDAAFTSCVVMQIEHFRKPSLYCVDL